MNYGKYQEVADYVQSMMSVDDFAHTCRVVNYALQILDTEKKADANIVVISAFLHDIGRAEGAVQNHDKSGSDRSYAYLTIEKGYTDELARRIADCVLTHGNSSKTPPQTLEAKILFDADKLDTTGAVGTMRAVLQNKDDGIPIYTLGKDGLPLCGEKEEPKSLMKEYRRKLKKVKKVFFTEKARKIAAKHQSVMDKYFTKLAEELESNYKKGNKLSKKYFIF